MSISLRLRVAGLAATVVAVGLLSTSAFAQVDVPQRRNGLWEGLGRGLSPGLANSWYAGPMAGIALAGMADMIHPFAPAATDASISGGYIGAFGGTPCLFQVPSLFFAPSCLRVEGGINLSNISGTSPPNFGGEIMRAKIRSFAVLDAQVVTPIYTSTHSNDWYPVPGFRTAVDLFYGVGPAVGNTSVDFAGAATSNTRLGFNAQAGFIFRFRPNMAVRANYFIVDLGSTPIPTAAGTGRVDFWAQGVNFGLEFRY